MGSLSSLPGACGRCQQVPPDFDREAVSFSLSHFVCVSKSFFVSVLPFGGLFCLIKLEWLSDLEPHDPAKLWEMHVDNWGRREMRKMQPIVPQLILFYFSSVWGNGHFLNFSQGSHNRQPPRKLSSLVGRPTHKVNKCIVLLSGLEGLRWEGTQVGRRVWGLCSWMVWSRDSLSLSLFF